MKRKLQIGVMGSAGLEEYPEGTKIQKNLYQVARRLGFLLAKKGTIIVTGGKGGIMEEVSKGAKKAGGLVVAVLKGSKRNVSNQFTDVEILTGMDTGGSEFIQPILCDGLIILGGGAGTLQEIAVAYRIKRPIVTIDTLTGWGSKLSNSFLDDRKLMKIIGVKTPEQAVKIILSLLNKQKRKK
jgi:hypothetical protein